MLCEQSTQGPGFPGSSDGKESSCKADLGPIPGLGRPLKRRKWQLTPVFLPGDYHRQRSLVGHSPMGSQRVGHNWETNTFAFLFFIKHPAPTTNPLPFFFYSLLLLWSAFPWHPSLSNASYISRQKSIVHHFKMLARIFSFFALFNYYHMHLVKPKFWVILSLWLTQKLFVEYSWRKIMDCPGECTRAS